MNPLVIYNLLADFIIFLIAHIDFTLKLSSTRTFIGDPHFPHKSGGVSQGCLPTSTLDSRVLAWGGRALARAEPPTRAAQPAPRHVVAFHVRPHSSA